MVVNVNNEVEMTRNDEMMNKEILSRMAAKHSKSQQEVSFL